MNMESGIGGDVTAYEVGRPAPSRRRLIVALVAAALATIALVYYLGHRHSGPTSGDATLQRVTFVVPGRSRIATTTSATGTIGARRDQPVGVAGEGGVVRSVLAEPGDWVKAGQILAVVDRSVQSQQAAALAASIDQARADAALARSNLDRSKKLISNGFVAQADIDAKQAALDSANARVAVATAQLAQQRALIGRLDIRAPAAGLILTRAVEAGQIVGPASGALFRVAEDGAMEVQARIAEADLARMAVGNPATVTPVGSNLRIEGHIWQISPVIDPNSRQGTVRVALPFRAELRPGGFASVDLGGAKADLPLLPESAVLSDAKGNFVFVIGQDGKVSRQPVTVGGVDDRGVSIVSGLNGHERVVASAGAFLNPGDKVTPVLATVH